MQGIRRWFNGLDLFNRHLVFLIIITLALNLAYTIH